MPSPTRWAILTGEYPPQPGGVSDYTRLVAEGLHDAGDEVQVWAPSASIPNPAGRGVRVHRLPDHYGPRAVARLARDFARLPPGTRVLVQYVPHVWGWKAMNVPFCGWLWAQGWRHDVTVMFHEVAYPWVSGGRVLRHNFLAAVNRLMALLAARSARQLYVSIPAWMETLRPLCGGRPIEWLPVPSTMPGEVDPVRVAACRREVLRGRDWSLVGHFGTFGGHIAEGLRQAIPPLLADEPQAALLLVGRGGEAFTADLLAAHPTLADRVRATGPLEAPAVSDHLSACDLLIQPYIDGISSRRTSAMAGLACGLPILTTRGALTEPLWEHSGAVRLVESAAAMAPAAGALLRDTEALAHLRHAARKLYAERFSLEHTLARLRSTSAGAAGMVSAP